MGIPGLTTYIQNREDDYFQYYELHDSYLVIDGNSVCCQLAQLHPECNPSFGGDYDKFRKCVSDFFDGLLQCNVTPLVLYDGAIEEKKLRTAIKRTNDKLQIGSHYNPSYHNHFQFFPLFSKLVFMDVIEEKNIRCWQCLFEADNTIAALAKLLNCPVLSYDSDFFVFGTKYIPFNRIESRVYREPGRWCFKKCKIYTVERLLKCFSLDMSMLPLVAVLLGNDYVDRRIFNKFYCNLRLPKSTKANYNDQQRRIEAVLNWLSKHSFNNAVAYILSTVWKPKRREVLEVMEMVINGYTNLSSSILSSLGFSEEQIKKLNIQHTDGHFKFDEDIWNMVNTEKVPVLDSSQISEDEEISGDEKEELIDESEFSSAENIVDHLPPWFIKLFNQSVLPPYFLGLLTGMVYIPCIQLEDYFYPPICITVTKILSVIHGLLTVGMKANRDRMLYMMRNENNKLATYELERNSLFDEKVSTLFNLQTVPLTVRKEILHSTLGIVDEQCINELPPDWSLYIAAAKYWVDQQQEPLKSNCHIYSLLFCMLFNIIDCKIGYCRSLNTFQSKHGKNVEKIQCTRKQTGYKSVYSVNVSVKEALSEVNFEDCLLVAPFFISNFNLDYKYYSNLKKFDITIVHAFNEFQSCLMHSDQLNRLLGCPYQPVKVANLFNGTLLYNLYTNFKKRNDVEVYINGVLENSPSLLRLFHVLLSTVKPLFTIAFKNEGNVRKRKAKRTSTKQTVKSDINNVDDECENDNTDDEEEEQEDSYSDPNNPFSLLCTVK